MGRPRAPGRRPEAPARHAQRCPGLPGARTGTPLSGASGSLCAVELRLPVRQRAFSQLPASLPVAAPLPPPDLLGRGNQIAKLVGAGGDRDRTGLQRADAPRHAELPPPPSQTEDVRKHRVCLK